MVQAIKELIPSDNSLLDDYYQHKKIISMLSFLVVEIDACKNGCMLYWKDDQFTLSYKFCGLSRYKKKGVNVIIQNTKSCTIYITVLTLDSKITKVVCITSYSKAHDLACYS